MPLKGLIRPFKGLIRPNYPRNPQKPLGSPSKSIPKGPSVRKDSLRPVSGHSTNEKLTYESFSLVSRGAEGGARDRGVGQGLSEGSEPEWGLSGGPGPQGGSSQESRARGGLSPRFRGSSLGGSVGAFWGVTGLGGGQVNPKPPEAL